jgi:hypothetical protein
METLLDTLEDFVWIKEVFNVDCVKEMYVCVIVYGNLDAPEKIEFFKVDKWNRKPDYILTPKNFQN